MVQGELFRDDSNSPSGIERSKRSFLSRHQITFALDKIVLVFIAFVIIFALTYSFGVEQGKRDIEKHLDVFTPSHSDTVAVNVETVTPATPPSPETVLFVNQTPAQDTALPSASSIQPPELMPVSEEAKPLAAAIEVPKPLMPTVDLAKKGSFTVQLVTYNDEALAAREIKRLKASGHESFVILSGNYYQVCANYFDDKSKARGFLKHFSDLQRYPDAYIRPVVR